MRRAAACALTKVTSRRFLGGISRAWYGARVSEGVKDRAARADAAKQALEPEWPLHFPPNCPPKSARPVKGRVYRRIGHGAIDWQSARERGVYKEVNEPQRASLSCFLDLAALRETLDVHEEWTARQIVFADLKPAHGAIKKTGKHHHSLWLRRVALAQAPSLFQPVP